MPMLQTPRLALDELSPETDAAFILELLNEPTFLRFIGDRQVRSQADAARYIENGPRASYRRLGFGLYRVSLRATGDPIGICGLLKRDALEHVDIGFAFLPRCWRQGYAHEAAAAILQDAVTTHAIRRVLALTALDNEASIKLLEKLGFRFEKVTRLSEQDSEVKLFSREAGA